jgi:fatty-acyl-CoA synthase
MAGLHEGGKVGSMLITAIVRHAERPAIADDRTRWTYRELGENVGRLISFFRSLGLKKGGAVSVLSTNRVETWAVVTAAASWVYATRRYIRSRRKTIRSSSPRTPRSTR